MRCAPSSLPATSPVRKFSMSDFTTFLSVLALTICLFPASAAGQRISKKMVSASGEDKDKDTDQPQKRALWNARGREAPKGQTAAALRLRAHQQKMAMRAERAAAAMKAGSSFGQNGSTTSWVSLGPSPLASDATGDGGQDYNWVSGRATSVLIDPADATGNTVLLGGAYGGLWRSTNAGSLSTNPDSVTWQSLIDDQPSLAVGAIALQPGNSNLILVGTGETNASGDSYYGVGILRSTDGGTTWTQITSAASGQSFVGVGFSKMAFSTSNTNLVVASTAGDIGFDFGLEQDANSTARGLYYSSDAGATWNRVMLADGAVPASVTGLLYNSTSGTFFAAIRRHGIYSSTDGIHFSRLATQPGAGLASANCPASSNSTSCQIYRAEFAVTPGRNETYVWVMDVQSSEVDGGIWRSTNAGSSWTQIPDNGITNCGSGGGGTTSNPEGGCGVDQGEYDIELAALPNSTGTDLYAGTINLYKCTIASGASSCSTIDSNVPNDWINLTHVYGCNILGSLAHVHPDQHALGFLVAGGKATGYFAHDGGISRTLDGYTGLNSGSCTGTNRFDSLSQTLGSMTEFVSFSVHPTTADIMLGGTQDNGSPSTATATTSLTWENSLGGDGGFNAINPNPGPVAGGSDGVAGDEWFLSNPDSVIGVCENGTACNDNSAFLEALPGYPNPNVGNIDQGAFYTPFVLDPQNTNEMLIGTCRIWRGPTASTVANQLSVFNELSVNFDTLDATLCNGSEINQVAGLAANGPKDTNGFSTVIYATTWGYGPFAGEGGGEVWVTTNAAATTPAFTNVTGSINPNNYAIQAVALDTSGASGQTAYIGIMGFHTSHVWKTTNAGTGWTDWTGNLPDAPVVGLVVDSEARLVYAGTDVGVFSSPTTGTGGVWTEVGPAAGTGPGYLPSAPVTGLRLFNNGVIKRLRVSTYGRGIWEYALPLIPDYTNVISDSPQTVFPTQTATFHGTLTAEDGYSSPVNLTCTGTPPSTCTPSPTQVTPKNSGAAYTITAGGAVGDYSFNAHAVGTDANTMTHDGATTLHVVDFAVATFNPTTLVVPQGASGSTAFQVTGAGSFALTVTLSCSGLPTGATCSFSPSSTINPTSANPVAVTVTVNTTGSTPQASSTITVQGTTTSPSATRSGTFTLTVGPPPDFSIAPSSTGTSHTVLAGQTTLAYSFNMAALGGAGTFAGNVTFSCTGLPDPTAVCVFNPTQITAGTSSPQTVSLTITTKGPNSGTGTLRQQAHTNRRSPWLPLAVPLAGIVMVGISRRKRSKGGTLAGLCIALVLLAVLIACGGGGSSSSPPPPVAISLAPSTPLSLYADESGNGWPAAATQQQYTATVTNATNTAVSWQVNGVAGGNSTVGTITSGGLYTSPATVPSPANFNVTAIAQADTTKTASDQVTIQAPTTVGSFPITVTATEGSKSHTQQVTLIVQ